MRNIMDFPPIKINSFPDHRVVITAKTCLLSRKTDTSLNQDW